MKNQSISHGTLRTEDLIETFMGFISDNNLLEKLEWIPPMYQVFMELHNSESSQFKESFEETLELWYDTDEAQIFLNDALFDFLNYVAPEGFYFGSHPGDGSDFGFWEIEKC